MKGKKDRRAPMGVLLCAALFFILALEGCGTGTSQSSTAQTTDVTFPQSAAETQAVETAAPAESAETDTTAEEVVYPYDFTQREFTEIENFWEYAPKAAISGVKENGSYFKVRGNDGYGTCQGSCTDGTYVYMFLQNAKAKFENGDFTSMCKLYKIDMATWEVAAESEPLEVDHGNSITYNSKTGELVVSNAKPNNYLISKIDPETLTVTDVMRYPSKLSGISYNALRDQYVIRFTGGYDFAILDADFKELKRFPGVNTGLTLQNIDSDDEYIYITDTSQNKEPSAETMAVYDWDGNYLGLYRIDSKMENEGMFNFGGKYYMTFNNAGGRIYQVEFDKSLLGQP